MRLTNVGDRAAEEVSQLYIHDVTASLVRPVRELKAFRRTRLEPGASAVLEFAVATDDLVYYDNQALRKHEAGRFRLGVGGDSTVPLTVEFTLGETAVAKESLPEQLKTSVELR